MAAAARAARARRAAAEPRDFEAQAAAGRHAGAYKRLAALGDNLREAFVVSQLSLEQSERASADADDDVLVFELSPADGEKCVRCWKFRQLGIDPAHPSICAECAEVVRALER